MLRHHRFRGSLLRSKWIRSQPTDTVELIDDELRLHPWLRSEFVLRREDVSLVRLEKTRLPPFWWTTDLHFTLKTGRDAERFFRPLRPTKVVRALRERGWTFEQ